MQTKDYILSCMMIKIGISPTNQLYKIEIMEFEQLYKSYWEKVFRLCLSYVNDYNIAQDIAQETFIIIWEKLHTFRNEVNIRS